MDLTTRGGGDLLGQKQWGMSDIGMEAIRNIRLVEHARQYAKDIVAANPDLSQYPLLRAFTDSFTGEPHLE